MRSEGGLRRFCVRKRPNRLLLEASSTKGCHSGQPEAVWGSTPTGSSTSRVSALSPNIPALRVPQLPPSPSTFFPLSLSTSGCPVPENSYLFYKTRSTSILKLRWMASSLPRSQNRTDTPKMQISLVCPFLSSPLDCELFGEQGIGEGDQESSTYYVPNARREVLPPGGS